MHQENINRPTALDFSLIATDIVNEGCKTEFTDEDIRSLADAFMMGNSNSNWLMDWVNNSIDIATDDINNSNDAVKDFIASQPLLKKIIDAPVEDINIVEKLIARKFNFN